MVACETAGELDRPRAVLGQRTDDLQSSLARSRRNVGRDGFASRADRESSSFMGCPVLRSVERVPETQPRVGPPVSDFAQQDRIGRPVGDLVDSRPGCSSRARRGCQRRSARSASWWQPA